MGDGVFQSLAVPEGRSLRIWVRKTGYQPRLSETFEVEGKSEILELPPLRLRRGSELQVVVTHAGGRPAKGAEVALYPGSAMFHTIAREQRTLWDPGQREGPRPSPRSRCTDAAGIAVFDGLTAGEYWLRVVLEGAPQALANGIQVPGQGRTRRRIDLAPPTSLSGQVVDERGDPAVGYRVTALQEEGWWFQALCDGEGRFRIPALEAGRYLVQADHPEDRVQVAVHDKWYGLYGDGLPRLNIQVRRGTFPVVVVAGEEARVNLTVPLRRLGSLVGQVLLDEMPGRALDVHFQFQREELPGGGLGSWGLTTRGPRTGKVRTEDGRIGVDAGGVVIERGEESGGLVEIRTAVVEGTVVSNQDVPVARAVVFLGRGRWSPELGGPSGMRVETRKDGRFSFGSVTLGQYWLGVMARGWTPHAGAGAFAVWKGGATDVRLVLRRETPSDRSD